MGVSCAPLGIGGGEDGVDKDEGADDLGAKAGALVVAGGELVGPTTVPDVVGLLEALHKTNPTDGPKALSDHVHHSSYQRHLPSQEQTESHCRIYVPTCTS